MKKDVLLDVLQYKKRDVLIYKGASPYIENGRKSKYCSVSVWKQHTAKKHSARAFDFVENSDIKARQNLENIRFFKTRKYEKTQDGAKYKKIRAYNQKKRVNNFLINNVARKTLRENKQIAYLRAVALVSSKL